jgi:hypothetical protein
MYKKMESVIQQLLARDAQLYILCNEGDDNMRQYEAKGCHLIQVSCCEREHVLGSLCFGRAGSLGGSQCPLEQRRDASP